MAEAWQADPQYLNVLRSLALQGTTAEAGIRSEQDAARRQLTDVLPEIVRRGLLQRQMIGGGYENNGLARSSANQDTQAGSHYDQAFQTLAAQSGTADRVGSLENQLAQERAGSLARQTDAEGAARLRQYETEHRFFAPPKHAGQGTGPGPDPFSLDNLGTGQGAYDALPPTTFTPYSAYDAIQSGMSHPLAPSGPNDFSQGYGYGGVQAGNNNYSQGYGYGGVQAAPPGSLSALADPYKQRYGRAF